MIQSIRGKLLLGGLALAAFTKVAVSLPQSPLTDDMIADTGAGALRVAGSAEAPPPDDTPDIMPPLVEGLGNEPVACEAPEELLQSLAKERELIALQRDKVEAEVAEVALLKEKLGQEKANLIELKESINALLDRVEAAQTEDLTRLVDLYRNMKPADAARVMDDMDIETSIMVLGTMQPRVAAPILSKMSPVRVRAVSKIIFERSQLPGDQDLNGIRIK